jgi:hypothetical protein
MTDHVQNEMIEHDIDPVVVVADEIDNIENEFYRKVDIQKNNHNKYLYLIQLLIIYLIEINYRIDIKVDEDFHHK